MAPWRRACVPPVFGATLADAEAASRRESRAAARGQQRADGRHRETDDRAAHQQLAPRHPPLVDLFDQVLAEFALQIVLVHAAVPLVRASMGAGGRPSVLARLRHYPPGFQVTATLHTPVPDRRDDSCSDGDQDGECILVFPACSHVGGSPTYWTPGPGSGQAVGVELPPRDRVEVVRRLVGGEELVRRGGRRRRRRPRRPPRPSARRARARCGPARS